MQRRGRHSRQPPFSFSGQCPKPMRSKAELRPSESVLQTRNSAAGRRRFGLRWQSAAATPLSERGPPSESGMALRFPPQSISCGCVAAHLPPGKRVRGNPARAKRAGLRAGRCGKSMDFLPIATGANPEGCQKVAGGRPGQGGNDHRKTCIGSAHPGGVPDVALIRSTPARMTGRSEISLAPQPGCRSTPAPLSGGRLPQDPRRPATTLCQPFGLARPECPISSGPAESAILLATPPIGATPLSWGKSEILHFRQIVWPFSPPADIYT